MVLIAFLRNNMYNLTPYILEVARTMPSTNPKQTNNNKNYPLLSLDGWYEHGQLLLENTYLQPFKQTSNGFSKTIRIKENPRNGYIEREIHGAMHASRVAWSSMMLHKLCQQHYAVAAESKFNSLLKYLDLKEDDVLCLIRYVALGHDAAREGDGYDRWEAESAEKIQHFFESHSIETEKAIILSKLASLKDKPKELTEFLQEQKLSSEAIEGLQYARVLISLSDCFDIIRCNRLFDFKYITQKLSEVFDYEPEKDGSVFFEYAKNLLEIIKKQQDLYFPTELIGFNKETYRLDEGEADYSPKAKVGLEHASNAIMAMQISLQQHPYFAKLLPFESPIEEIESEVKPAFNPYIHGTNSSALGE